MNQITVPSILEDEFKYNPYLRLSYVDTYICFFYLEIEKEKLIILMAL